MEIASFPPVLCTVFFKSAALKAEQVSMRRHKHPDRQQAMPAAPATPGAFLLEQQYLGTHTSLSASLQLPSDIL